MKNPTLAVLALALTMGSAIAPQQAYAQFDFGGGGGNNDGGGIGSFKFNAKTRIKLDFRNSNIDSVLSLLQKTSGITIVKDPSLTGTITLTSAKAVPLKEAFQILETTLGLKNYEIRKEGNLMVIAQRRADRGGGNQQPVFMPPMQEQNELKVYPIKFANASQVARVVNEVFAGGGGTGGGFPGNIRFGGGGGNQGGRGNQRGGQQFQFPQFGQQQNAVRASADDFSNSVIVNAPSRSQREVSDLIAQIDKETDQPQNSRVYKLTYASATEAASVLQNVLQANAPRGRGGATTSQQQQNNLPFFLRGPSQGQGAVVADARTNTVVVTATEENQGIVAQVLKELDQPVELASTTFVFPLQNARAEDIADLLSQAFGQRTGVNGGRRTNTTPGQQRRNTSAAQRQGGGNTGRSREQADNSLPIDLEDPNAESGELLTSVAVTQGGGFQFFGGQGNQNRQGQNANQTARTSDGRIVNVNDLTNQITVIPDNNTNSVIVVAAPGAAELVQSILGQLDRIPEQVMIETIIVEATLDDTTKLGVEFGLNITNFAGTGTTGNAGTGFGLQTTPLPPGGRVSLSGGNLTAFVNALRTDQRFNVLSTPRIFTSNNQEAQINISQQVPYVLSTRQDTLGGIQYNYDFLDVGVVLTVTPRITSNGYVTMDIDQTADELQSFTNFNAPIINQRQANTTVSVLDGETIVLGGIIRNSVSATTNKVPILGDIPILGNIFRSTTKQNTKTELLVLLRPRIIRDDAEARAMRKEQQERLSLPTREQLKRVLPPDDGPISDPREPDKDPGSGAGTPPGKDPAKPPVDPAKPPVDPTKKTPPPSNKPN